MYIANISPNKGYWNIIKPYFIRDLIKTDFFHTFHYETEITKNIIYSGYFGKHADIRIISHIFPNKFLPQTKYYIQLSFNVITLMNMKTACSYVYLSAQ